ncbi:MAG: HAMP domain-containing histidine kinase [Chloroflexi bacterium]|nr:HAMP domain-containing histidine kinase [Chloroflexota bacterium]
MKPFAGIRWRLAAWNLVVLGIVLVVTVGAALLSEARVRDAGIERELRLGAEREVASFSHEGDAGEDSRSQLTAASDLFAFWVDRRGATVRNTRQVALPGLPDTAALSAALSGGEVWTDRVADGVPVRLLSVPAYHDGRIDGAVQVGKPLTTSQREAAELTRILLLTGLAGLGLSAVGSLFLAERAMRPIREAFERQRRFIADASHELRTPVAVLRARAEVLQREGAQLSPAEREQVHLLRRDAEELSTLLGELLDLARLDAGQVQLPLESLALADVAEEIVAQLAPLAEQRQVRLRAVTEPVWGRGSLSRLRQALRALADNALKHTPPGGSIQVEAARQGDWARLRVTDSGPGIPSDHLSKVAEPFYRADTARSRAASSEIGGAGLGLAIASELVRLMHGQLRLESQPNQGTTATILLPLAERQGQPSATAVASGR